MSAYTSFCDRYFGPCTSHIPTAKNEVYLSFDDGPDPDSTPAVLDLLSALQVRATFFVVTQKGKSHKGLLQRISTEGHSLGNHSLDHRYRYFFRSHKTLLKWVSQSQEELTQLIGKRPVGFRSPAGVRTPVLHAVLQELGIPLIHWSVRSYDSIFPYTPERALSSSQATQAGSIVLLHDSQKPEHLHDFLLGLKTYIEAIKNRGFSFAPLKLGTIA